MPIPEYITVPLHAPATPSDGCCPVDSSSAMLAESFSTSNNRMEMVFGEGSGNTACTKTPPRQPRRFRAENDDSAIANLLTDDDCSLLTEDETDSTYFCSSLGGSTESLRWLSCGEPRSPQQVVASTTLLSPALDRPPRVCSHQR